jgi:phage I-like protein
VELLAFVADAPGLVPETALPTSRVQIARAGSFKHPRYGAFTVDETTFDAFRAHLAAVTRLPVDFEHAPDKGGSSEAAGWITALEKEDGKLFATVEWTANGAKAIRERRFLFISPTWKMKGKDDTGTDHGPRLLGAGLTNRPWFERMGPVVSMSATFDARAEADPPEDFEATDTDEPAPDPDPDPEPATHAAATVPPAKPKEQEKPGNDPAGTGPDPDKATDDEEQALIDAHKQAGKPHAEIPAMLKAHRASKATAPAATHDDGPDGTSDSRPPMDSDQLISVFGLDPEATDEDILTAAREKVEEAGRAPRDGYLVLTEDNDIIFTAEQVNALETRARRGDEAVEQLSEMTFDNAFSKAIRQGRVSPVQKTDFARMFDQDEDGTLRTLENLKPIVSVEPKGSSGHTTKAGEDKAAKRFAIEGDSAELDRESLDLVQKAELYAKDHDMDFGDAYRLLAEGAAF